MHIILDFVAVAVLVAGYRFARQSGPSWRMGYIAFATLAALRGMRLLAIQLREHIAHPPRFDFFCFWLDGRVALLYHNVYAPEFFHLIGDGLKQRADFVREFLDVGFLYPPISIVWFAPLGLFKNPQTAMAAWCAFLVVTLALAITALWKQFFREWGVGGIAIAAALVMLIPTLFPMFDVTQTVGIALLFAVLFRGDSNPWRCGLWIALAISIKPFLITLLIVPILTRAWRSLSACAASLAALTAAALALISPAGFVTYIHDNPVTRVPGSMYYGMWNQSLLGWLLRFEHREPASLAVGHETLYLVLAALIACATVVVCLRLVRINRDAAIAMSLLLGLLVYPQTLFTYTVLLALPIAIVWTQCLKRTPQHALWIGLAIAMITTMLGTPDGILVYLGIIATAAVVLVVGFTTNVAPRPSFVNIRGESSDLTGRPLGV